VILSAGLSSSWQQVLVFDELRPGEVNRASRVRWYPAGKVTNAARAAHRLVQGRGTGGPSRGLTILGGFTGDAMARALEEEGLSMAVVRSKTPTRVCTTVIDEAEETITELVENAGPVSREELEEFHSIFRREAEEARAIVLTGSLTENTPPDYYYSLLQDVSAPVVLDARGPELMEALKLRPFLVKPNRQELARTTGLPIGTEADLRAAMIDLSRKGARWVLVTQGQHAVWLHGEGSFHRFRPPRVPIVNPIASGDCMAGGVAYAISRGAEIIEAVRTGIACAVENVTALLPADIDCAGVDRRLESVAVETV